MSHRAKPTPCHATPHHATPHHAMPCYVILCHATPCHATSHHAKPCHTVPSHTMPCHTTPCRAVSRRATVGRAMPQCWVVAVAGAEVAAPGCLLGAAGDPHPWDTHPSHHPRLWGGHGAGVMEGPACGQPSQGGPWAAGSLPHPRLCTQAWRAPKRAGFSHP